MEQNLTVGLIEYMFRVNSNKHVGRTVIDANHVGALVRSVDKLLPWKEGFMNAISSRLEKDKFYLFFFTCKEKDTKISRYSLGIGFTTYVNSTSVNSDLEVLWESFYQHILKLHELYIANLVESDNDLEFESAFTLDWFEVSSEVFLKDPHDLSETN